MSSALSSWRQFQLFDFTPIRDPSYNSDDPLYSDPTLSCINATTSTYLLIAVNNSTIKIINPKNLTCQKAFQAYDVDYRITFIEPVHNSNNLVVTLAEKQGNPSVIKLWDINKMIQLDSKVEEADCKYKFQTQVLVSNHDKLGDNSYPISCFRFNYVLTCLAVGYTNGKVILIRGDLLRDRGSKQRVVYMSGNDPITGVHFNETEQLLYVTTTGKILTVPTTGRNQEKPTRILSQKFGADLNCTDVSDDEAQELIVGLPDSIQFYDTNFLLIVSPQDDDSKKVTTRVLILDLVNNHIAFNLLIPNSSVFHAFMLSGDLYLLTSDGILYKIHEKPVNQQIEIILQRELFSVAFNLAQQKSLPNETLLKIENLHGDYLYDQAQFDEAIGIYIKCLELFDDNVDQDIDEFIMNIITKFKEAVNIPNLTQFLIRLYEKSLASIDHITLLLCCYCKLKKIDNLDSFINDLDLTIENLQDLNFELIINLFKECGFYDQVLKLLYKLDQPNLIVDIQLNDLKKPKLALSYMKTLRIDELLLILIDHSENLYTGARDKKSIHPTYLPPKPNLIYASFTNHPKEFVIFLEASIEAFEKFQGKSIDKHETVMTLLEIYLSLHKSTSDQEWLDKANNLSKQYAELTGNEVDLFMRYQLNENIEGCFGILEKYGDAKPELYKYMLTFIVSKKTIFDKVSNDDIQVLLQQINNYKLLKPMELLELLTENPDNDFITYGLVKDYFVNFFKNQNQEIQNNQKLIEKYEQESTKNSYKLSELTKPMIIQNNKCSSFANSHADGGDNGSDDDKIRCPLCVEKFNDIKDQKEKQHKVSNKENYEVFVNALHESKDKFKFVSDYIGKGVMEHDSITLNE
ncbi:E3 ubiquitin-protein ligase PEP5 [Candida viswanathii]|uniref:E3 ubiquitin-protein ligase PEP5 n=1 Tax=Candida viswanathii TaxID=5486 RepID=A0A367XS24_9ASCO|nr:E3 ubiquitin-protein ligase PEP5 [Candida viswanathii]